LSTERPSIGQIYIGISGWRYAGWRGVFYPPKLAQRRELEFAATHFRSVEINGTFYSLQRPSSFRAWRDATPARFTFTLKGPRFITHMLKLRNAEQALANFCANGMLELGHKLGPILWQFPPQLRFDPAKFTTFFKQLPKTQAAVARLARLHDDRLNGRNTLTPQRGSAKLPVHHCVEIRHESFACADFVDLLRKHNIGLVLADTVEWPLFFDLTADFVYIRLHGSEKLYWSQYNDDALGQWADRIVAWATGKHAEGQRVHRTQHHTSPRDVYVYFDNDAAVHAPFDAIRLQQLVDVRLGRIKELPRRREPQR
jgi:uncharacterized protein YecE (DUF72 family)